MMGQFVTLGQYNACTGWVALTVTGASFSAWSPANGNWSVISLHATYEPAPLPNYPARTRPRGGELGGGSTPASRRAMARLFERDMQFEARERAFESRSTSPSRRR
jgi:hypothetical protein